MTLTRTHAAVLFVAVTSAAAAAFIHAQTQISPAAPPAAQVPQPPLRPTPLQPARAVIFLDPAHGSTELGATLGNNIAEKDVTLAFAQLLRPALVSAGFSIITTRDSDLPAPLPTDQRAEAANRAHALACLVIHATASGTGVHLFTSPLAPSPQSNDTGADSTTPFNPIPWESAQSGFVDQSRRLSDVLKATLAKTGLPILTGTAPLRPLDNLMCPAIAIEIAPRDASTPSTDPTYQQQIAAALANALQLWRDQNSPSGSGSAQ